MTLDMILKPSLKAGPNVSQRRGSAAAHGQLNLLIRMLKRSYSLRLGAQAYECGEQRREPFRIYIHDSFPFSTSCFSIPYRAFYPHIHIAKPLTVFSFLYYQSTFHSYRKHDPPNQSLLPPLRSPFSHHFPQPRSRQPGPRPGPPISRRTGRRWRTSRHQQQWPERLSSTIYSRRFRCWVWGRPTRNPGWGGPRHFLSRETAMSVQML